MVFALILAPSFGIMCIIAAILGHRKSSDVTDESQQQNAA